MTSVLSNPSVSVEGFGNVGEQVATSLFTKGIKVTAVSDSKGVVTNKDGLDIEALKAHKANSGGVFGICRESGHR